MTEFISIQRKIVCLSSNLVKPSSLTMITDCSGHAPANAALIAYDATWLVVF